MNTPPPSSRTMSDHKGTTCVAHHCPKCGLPDHVVVEQELSGTESVIRCHCRSCGHSWHPVAVTNLQ